MCVYVWGINTSGQLGIVSDEDCICMPTLLTTLSVPPLLIAAGGSHVVCVGETGEVFSWGDNQKSQLGIGSAKPKLGSPSYIMTLPLPCQSVSCGGSHSGIVDGKGNVWMWGNGVYGQLGMGLECEKCDEPTLLKKLCNREICKVSNE